MCEQHNQALAEMFKGLVKQVGGTDAARAVIEAYVGHGVSKGTISQIQNAKAMVPWEWVSALEDAAGNLPFHRLRTNQIESTQPVVNSLVCHLKIVKESAEATMATAEAEGSSCPKKITASLNELLDLLSVTETLVAQQQARLDRMGLEASE